ncbi:MAG: acetyl-CoA carboxylase biotin carboxyl carrier protein [Ruminococcus sp.]|nr:acetyl-CoA carboxylase biotin carboxyl carrier protein [Ruminococcus sp.]
MYNIDEIKEFIAVLEDSSLSVLEIQNENGSKIRLEKPQVVQQVASQTAPVAQPTPVAQLAPTTQSAPAQAVPAVETGKAINAPIVGVFYAAPSPDAQPYVSVGKQVKKGDTVCIIEAMKCMNEIQAEEDGEIIEILAKDGELVEYGQPLFKIR